MAETSELAITTNPGLESLTFDELRRRLAEDGADPQALTRVGNEMRGRVHVRFAGPRTELARSARRLRSAHHLLRPVAAFPLGPGTELADLERAVTGLSVPEMAGGPPFRITSERRGEHDFTSHDLQRVAGAVLARHYGAPVDLEGFAVEVTVDVVEQWCAVGVRLTREPLSRRHPQHYLPRVSLKPNMAYALVHLAALPADAGAVLDPFCGSGTVLLEAGAVLPEAELWGGDWSPRSVAGARANLSARDMAGRARLAELDARRMAEALPPGHFDAVITNPPFGRRLGKGVSFAGFYTRLLEQAHPLLRPGGRLVLLADKRGAFSAALERAGGYRLLHERVVDVSRLFPAIEVLERL
jgi:putative N6-adenine-specific DNA methylase/tRNA (guanine6-N2)-methyltransferase